VGNYSELETIRADCPEKVVTKKSISVTPSKVGRAKA
jgi:hypothetical protein